MAALGPAMAVALALSAQAAAAAPFSHLERIAIAGYSGEAMEPFVSRDGRFLFFNTRNDPGGDTHIQWARRANDTIFRYLGPLPGVRSDALDAVPSMASGGRFCFVSTRSYFQTRGTVYCGQFDGAKVRDLALQTGLATARLGPIVFDVEIAADGQMLVYAEGDFNGGPAPVDAHLHMARLGPRGFEPWPEGDRILASTRGDGIEYAAALSAGGLELCYTHVEVGHLPAIDCATRTAADAPFGPPEPVAAITGFAEGPTLSADGHSLYVHRLIDGQFNLWRVSR
jgi:hypothetical protein